MRLSLCVAVGGYAPLFAGEPAQDKSAAIDTTCGDQMIAAYFLEETARLNASLRRLKVPMRRLLINNVVAEEAAGACDFCAARRRDQEKVVEEFRRRFARRAEIYVAPQQPDEVRGPDSLREHFESWRRLD